MLRHTFQALFLLAILLRSSPGGAALVALEDEALSESTGEGIAVVLEDFRFQMKNTGYVEQIGRTPAAGSGFQRGDMRWYGLTISSATAAGLGWTGESCGHLLCPLANAGALVAPFDNPFMMRVFNKTGYDFQNNSVSKTVLEWIGPTASDAYRWSFWGELEVGKDGTSNTGLLQSQTMIVGKPVANATGSLLRLFQNQDNNDRTLGLNFHSRLSGDFRFSLAQTSSSPGTLGNVPLFANGTTADNAPGLKFRNVAAYLPLGQLFYQSLILNDTRSDTTAGDGNFVIELTLLPNQTNAYTDFYSTPGANCTDARYTGVNCGYQRTSRPARYAETHGYSRWGDWYPGNGANCGAAGTVCNTFDNTTDGIVFSKASGAATFTATASRPNADAPLNNDPPVPVITQTRTGLASVNLGDSRIEGLLFQHLKVTTLGAGP